MRYALYLLHAQPDTCTIEHNIVAKAEPEKVSHRWFASLEGLLCLRDTSGLLLATTVFDCCLPEVDITPPAGLFSLSGLPLAIAAILKSVEPNREGTMVGGAEQSALWHTSGADFQKVDQFFWPAFSNDIHTPKVDERM